MSIPSLSFGEAGDTEVKVVTSWVGASDTYLCRRRLLCQQDIEHKMAGLNAVETYCRGDV